MANKEQNTPLSGVSSAALGGKARAANMTPEERAESARIAAKRRWSGDSREVVKATHRGAVVIGDLELPCAVLKDGTRVLSERGVSGALGGRRGGSHWRRKRSGSNLPVYVSATNLNPYITPSLGHALSQPIRYSQGQGGIANGLEATLLNEVCEVWLKARDDGALISSQMHIAAKADILIRGLARVGIVALIDDATGYTDVRDRNELHEILEAYINNELLPWSKTFPDDYYEQLFRLRGWTYSPPSVKRPQMVGKLTHDLIYKKLPFGVVEELKNQNPTNKKGHRRHKHFQFLTEDIGEPHLRQQLVSVTTLMRAARSWPEFQRMFDRAFPAVEFQGELFDYEEYVEED